MYYHEYVPELLDVGAIMPGLQASANRRRACKIFLKPESTSLIQYGRLQRKSKHRHLYGAPTL